MKKLNGTGNTQNFATTTVTAVAQHPLPPAIIAIFNGESFGIVERIWKSAAPAADEIAIKRPPRASQSIVQVWRSSPVFESTSFDATAATRRVWALEERQFGCQLMALQPHERYEEGLNITLQSTNRTSSHHQHAFRFRCKNSIAARQGRTCVRNLPARVRAMLQQGLLHRAVKCGSKLAAAYKTIVSFKMKIKQFSVTSSQALIFRAPSQAAVRSFPVQRKSTAEAADAIATPRSVVTAVVAATAVVAPVAPAIMIPLPTHLLSSIDRINAALEVAVEQPPPATGTLCVCQATEDEWNAFVDSDGHIVRPNFLEWFADAGEIHIIEFADVPHGSYVSEFSGGTSFFEQNVRRWLKGHMAAKNSQGRR
ncbi:hypothetical protein ON010_g16500 [Phytophthora cinnamomi]|nr:hypothetical protein ON010_g16500 [Phytophthora cinnamomi]